MTYRICVILNMSCRIFPYIFPVDGFVYFTTDLIIKNGGNMKTKRCAFTVLILAVVLTGCSNTGAFLSANQTIVT